MSPTPDERQPETGGLLRHLRLPVAFVLVFLLLLGGYYLLYSQRKTNYLVGRNLRLLATMGEGIEISISDFGKTLDSQKGVKTAKTTEVKGLRKVLCNSEDADLRPFLSPAKPMTGTLARLHGPSRSLELLSAHKVCGELDPDVLFASLFALRGAFDAVLLASPDGQVVYQRSSPGLTINRFDLLLWEGVEKDAKKKSDGALFSAAAGYRTLEIGGRDYKVFIEPVSLPIASSFANGGRAPWLLFGLVAADQFVYKSLAVSSSLLLPFLALLLLATLSWPLLRLHLIGERQRIRVLDVLLLGVCSLLGVAILTLALLDFYAFGEIKHLSEGQLQTFANSMSKNLSAEIAAAHRELMRLEGRVAAGTMSQEIPPANALPSWKDFELVDARGEQQRKWTWSGQVLPLIDVHDRAYFKAVTSGRAWSLPTALAYSPGDSFFLEPVTAWTTHVPEAMLAEPVTRPLRHGNVAVATLGIPVRSVLSPILPPGFEFAIIDEAGKVQFHSDPLRNGVENFFTETDSDQRLRSAVSARREETMGVRYFGEDYLAALKPVPGLPWTVVALRSQEQLRNLNMDWVVTTALFLLLSACPFVLVVCAVVIARPGYRAPWIWPDPERAADYVDLATLLAIEGLAFFLAIQHLPGATELLGVSWILPFFAILTSYVRLERRASEAGLRRIGSHAVFLLLLGVLLYALYKTPVEVLAGFFRSSPGVKVVLALLVLVAYLLGSLRPAWLGRWTENLPLSIGQAYPLALLLLLGLTIVLPTLGIFKAVHRLELYSFIRHGQLSLARTIVAQDSQTGAGGGTVATGTGYYGGSFFGTQLQKLDLCTCGKLRENVPLPEWLEDLLPRYSIGTADMRELLHERASDCSWDSHRVFASTMDLHHRVPNHEVLLRSVFPGLFTFTGNEIAMAGFLGQESSSSVLGFAASFWLFLLFILLLSALVLFISRRLFLVDLLEPLRRGRTIFWVVQDQLSPAEVEKGSDKLQCLDLQELDRGAEESAMEWKKRCRKLAESSDDILLMGFEHGIFDPEYNARKLDLLESLLELKERTVIVLSKVSPVHLLAGGEERADWAATRSLKRWQAVLSAFTLVDEDLRSRSGGGKAARLSFTSQLKTLLAWFRRSASGMPASDGIRSSVLREESGHDRVLRRIASSLDRNAQGMGREQLLEELGERAEGYYRGLWESCSRDEQVVLQHLAEEGLVNPKNRRSLRRLMARGLVRRGPSFCLMNESFRRFACSGFCRRQVIELEQRAAPSAWDRFRWPFVAVLAASLAFCFATQQELLDSTLAAVTGLTAGLPTVAKLMDLLSGQRTGVNGVKAG